ncbi:hypothetical protein HN51_012528, partial [Arachis hypogaea]
NWDHTFERRLRLGGPLVKENIATMVLESPFYGQIRLMLQRKAKLLCASDLFLLGRATIEEARSLLHWLDSEAGFGKMGVYGLSMGKTHPILKLTRFHYLLFSVMFNFSSSYNCYFFTFPHTLPPKL